jgi:[ribosomal protein S5]-alanine N-acetyltransferase
MRTTRLAFGTWSPDDLPLAAALWGDPEVTRLIGGPFPPTWVEERLALEIGHQAAFGFAYWPVFRLEDGAHVGCAGLRPVPGSAGTLELGFHLRPEHWGQGYATEAGRAVIGHAFRTTAARRLIAGHHPQNDASRRVLLRLGFRHTGDVLYPPTGLDHPTYELTAEEAARSGAVADAEAGTPPGRSG